LDLVLWFMICELSSHLYCFYFTKRHKSHKKLFTFCEHFEVHYKIFHFTKILWNIKEVKIKGKYGIYSEYAILCNGRSHHTQWSVWGYNKLKLTEERTAVFSELCFHPLLQSIFPRSLNNLPTLVFDYFKTRFCLLFFVL